MFYFVKKGEFMVKIKKGISMIALLITIAVFLILLTVITISSDKIINNTKKKQFAREIYEVQNLVDKYKYEKEEYPYTILDDNTKESMSIDITDDLNDQFDNEGVRDGDKVELYTIDLNKIGAENITRGIKKDNNLKDVYAFSEKTGIVYYIKGYKVGRNVYYTLTDELKGQIGYGKNTSNISNSKVIFETASMDYVQDGLVLLLDGIQNVRGWHSTSTNVWEDLSGNNNDLTLENVVSNSNNMYLDGIKSKIYSEKALDVVSVEIVLELEEKNGYVYIASFGSNSKSMAWSPVEDKGFSLGNVKKKYLVENLYKKNSISVQYNPDLMYLNSEKLKNNLASESWGSPSSYPIAFGFYGSNSYRMKGKIYSIRIYNRALTKNEINHNYEMDKKRFGI